MLKKLGVDDSRLSQRMADALAIVESLVYGEVVQTSTYESNHRVNSRHYRNKAVDIRRQMMIRGKPIDVERIKEALGPEFKVLDEGNHIHIADLKE